MNYEKLVREWVKHFGGSIRTDKCGPALDPIHHVILPEGMVDGEGQTMSWGDDWETIYSYLTQDVVYTPSVVGPVPGGAR